MAAPSLDVRAPSGLGSRFASSFDVDVSPAKVALPSAQTFASAAPMAESSMPLLQLRQPAGETARFADLFPSLTSSFSSTKSAAPLGPEPSLLQLRNPVSADSQANRLFPLFAEPNAPRWGSVTYDNGAFGACVTSDKDFGIPTAQQQALQAPMFDPTDVVGGAGAARFMAGRATTAGANMFNATQSQAIAQTVEKQATRDFLMSGMHGGKVTREGLDDVLAHLEQFRGTRTEVNKFHINNLEDHLAKGAPLDPATHRLYFHELMERKLMAQGVDYRDAHHYSLAINGDKPADLIPKSFLQKFPNQLFQDVTDVGPDGPAVYNAWRASKGLPPVK